MNKRCFECTSHNYQKSGEQRAICIDPSAVDHSADKKTPGQLFIFRSGSCHPLLENCFNARTQTTTTPGGRRD